MNRDKLVKHLHKFLKVDDFSDDCPNGLQVEGKKEISKIVTGVSACLELFKYAKAKKADTIIVHHGLIWNSLNPIYKGSHKERIKILLENNINLLAYHLPLDANLELGNNVEIAKVLGLNTITPFGLYNKNPIGIKGTIPEMEAHKFFKLIKDRINSLAQILPFGKKTINTVGIISGGGQKMINQAISDNLDVFITGESTEPNFHLAREEELHFIAAGHHATETFGIKALTDYIAFNLKIAGEFVNINNPF
jgi:dinuclear metal center YbgI/SA1388 family protein